MKLRFLSTPFGAASLAIFLTVIAPAVRAAELPALQVHSNQRVLATADDRPVFLLGDTAWSLVTRLSREDTETYLRKRKTQGFNAVAFVLCVPNGTDLAHERPNFYGALPFELKEGHFDPRRPITTPGNNPTDTLQYDYWDHVDFVVKLTNSLGLYAIVSPTWGTAISGSYDGKDTKDIIFDASSANGYGAWLAERYGVWSHVIWMVGGDRSAVVGETDYRPVYRALADGIHRLAPTQLMSFHPRKGAPQSGDWFHDDSWLSFNSIQHWPERQVQLIAADWQRTPTKPTWLFEGRYEGYWRNAKPGEWGEWQARQQAYQTVFAGGFGHVYGHERVFGFGTDKADWKLNLDTPGARSMSHLATFMRTFRPEEMLSRVPDPALLAEAAPPPERLRSDYIAATRTADRSLAMFYSASGRPVRVQRDLLAPTVQFAFWFNPRNGRWHNAGVESQIAHAFAHDVNANSNEPVREFIPPSQGDGADWVLVLASRPTL